MITPIRICRSSLAMFALVSALAAVLTAALRAAQPLPASAASSSDAEFRAQVDRFIEERLRLNPEWATEVGDHRYDGHASDLSHQAIENRILRAIDWKARFSRIGPKRLSPQNEADREWLIATCDGDLLRDEDIRRWRKSPGAYLPTAGIYALVVRDVLPLEDRMRLATARERASLKNFKAARENLTPDAMPKIAAEIVAREMGGTIAFFSSQLPAIFAGVPDGPAKSEFTDINLKTLAEIGAYQKWLLAELAPRASDNFAIGAGAYRRMLADDDMVNLPLSQLEDLGEQELARLKADFQATASRIDPLHSAADVAKSLSSTHPSPERLIPTVAAGLAEIRAFVVAHHLATIPQGAPDPMVRETPPYMRATTFASMDSPGPFEKSSQAYFYVTLPDPAWGAARKEQAMAFFSGPLLSDLTVHEVYPGHYVQFLNNRLNPDKVRSLFYSGANIEGWALYCEQMMIDQGLRGNDPAYRLAELQMALQRACRYLVGIRMHTRGMSVAEAANFFQHNAYMTPNNAMMEALRGTQDPGYLRYQLGKLMILKLRDDLRRKQGAAFDLGRFHDAFLKQGALPIALIRRALLGSGAAPL